MGARGWRARTCVAAAAIGGAFVRQRAVLALLALQSCPARRRLARAQPQPLHCQPVHVVSVPVPPLGLRGPSCGMPIPSLSRRALEGPVAAPLCGMPVPQSRRALALRCTAGAAPASRWWPALWARGGGVVRLVLCDGADSLGGHECLARSSCTSSSEPHAAGCIRCCVAYAPPARSRSPPRSRSRSRSRSPLSLLDLAERQRGSENCNCDCNCICNCGCYALYPS